MVKHLARIPPRSIVAGAALLGMLLLITLPSAVPTSAAPLAAGPDFGLLKDINPSGSSFPHNLVNFCCGKPIFFAANDGTTGIEPWMTDGTTDGTTLLKDINLSGDSSPSALVGLGTWIFSADDGTSGVELWRTFGDETNTVLEKDINPGPGSSFPMDMVLEGSSTFYFTADDGAKGREVWRKKFSGFTQTDIRPGATGSNPQDLTVVGSTLFFAADDGTSGVELWSSTGTTDGSTLIAAMVLDINTGGSSAADNLTKVGSTLFFAADDGTNGLELWKSDGTGGGTVLVKDIRPGGASSGPHNLIAVGTTLYFAADDGTNGIELWKSDGTGAGTVLVKDIAAGAPSSTPAELASVGGVLLFAADDGTSGVEPWTSDGTGGGTTLIKDVAAGTASSSPASFGSGGGAAAVVFVATESTAGREWWVTDLTSAGTKLFFDLNPGAASSSPSNEAVSSLSGDLIFAAEVAGASTELYSVPRDQFEGLEVTKTSDAGSSAEIWEFVTFTVTVTNHGTETIDVALNDFHTGAIYEDTEGGPGAGLISVFTGRTFVLGSISAGSSGTLTYRSRYLQSGTFSNTVTVVGDGASATAFVTIEEPEAAVKLTSAAGVTSAGTVVETTQITGETIEPPDGGCSESHLTGSITIAGAGDGPFADPDPAGCGWGPAFALPVFFAADGVLGVAGLSCCANETTVYVCDEDYVCTDLNGATLSSNPASPDFHASLAGATSAATTSVLIGSGCCDDVLTFGGFPDATGSLDRFVSSGAGDDLLTCTGGPGCAMDGGDGDDALVGGTGGDAMLGGPGNDTCDGKAGDDTCLFGPASTSQTDTVTEGAAGGFDTLDFSALFADDPLTVDLRVDSSMATHTNRVVSTGGAGQVDYFEQVIGGAGNDSFTLAFLATATRTIDGGAGTDTLTVDAGGGVATDNPGAAGSGTVTGPGGTITYVNIENVVLTNVAGATPPPVPGLSTWTLGALALALAAAAFVSTRRRREPG